MNSRLTAVAQLAGQPGSLTVSMAAYSCARRHCRTGTPCWRTISEHRHGVDGRRPHHVA